MPAQVATWFNVTGSDDAVAHLLTDAMQCLLSDTQRAVSFEFRGPYIAVSTERTGPADLLRVLQAATARVRVPLPPSSRVESSPPFRPLSFPAIAGGAGAPAPSGERGYAVPTSPRSGQTRSFHVTRAELIGIVTASSALLGQYFHELDPWAKPVLVGALVLLALGTAVYLFRAELVITATSVEITRLRRTTAERDRITAVIDRGPMHGRFIVIDGRERPVRLPHLSASDMWSVRDLLEGHPHTAE